MRTKFDLCQQIYWIARDGERPEIWPFTVTACYVDPTCSQHFYSDGKLGDNMNWVPTDNLAATVEEAKTILEARAQRRMEAALRAAGAAVSEATRLAALREGEALAMLEGTR